MIHTKTKGASMRASYRGRQARSHIKNGSYMHCPQAVGLHAATSRAVFEQAKDKNQDKSVEVIHTEIC